MADEQASRTPPYASFKSFDNFISHSREHPPLPERIDKSAMSHLNYGTQQALMAALRYFGLLNGEDRPTERMERLVAAQEDDRRTILTEMIREGYPYLWNGSIDLSRATSAQVVEKIREEGGVTGSTVNKAVAFFIAAAEAAGVKLSPHLTKRKASAPSGGGKRKRRPKPQPDANSGGAARQNTSSGTANSDADRWLAKFPDFDPSWPAALKKSWFAGYKDLMEMKKKSE